MMWKATEADCPICKQRMRAIREDVAWCSECGTISAYDGTIVTTRPMNDVERAFARRDGDNLADACEAILAEWRERRGQPKGDAVKAWERLQETAAWILDRAETEGRP